MTVLGGSWDLVSKVISTLIGVISIVTLFITSLTKSHDPPSSDAENHGAEKKEGTEAAEVDTNLST